MIVFSVMLGSVSTRRLLQW